MDTRNYCIECDTPKPCECGWEHPDTTLLKRLMKMSVVDEIVEQNKNENK